jgi:hypothetical protein
MDPEPTNGNKVSNSADVLEKIAAINHLTVPDVVWLFLVQALPEGERKLGTLELSPAESRRFNHEQRARPH